MMYYREHITTVQVELMFSSAYLSDHGKSQQVANKAYYSYEDFSTVTLP